MQNEGEIPRRRGRPPKPKPDVMPPKKAVGRPIDQRVTDRLMTAREYAMTHLFPAIDTWASIMNDEDAPHAARIAAAAHIANRAIGQPATAQPTDADTPDQTITRIERIVIDVPKKEAVVVKGVAKARS